MARSVVKHRYIKGKNLRERANAHLNYIIYRPDGKRSDKDLEDKEQGEKQKKESEREEKEASERSEEGKEKHDRDDNEPGSRHGRKSKVRIFHTPDNDKNAASEFRKAFQKENKPGFVIHKLMLSPGHNEADINRYTQEVMDSIGRSKGLDLRYGWVVHENTDHKHAHVIVLGTDKDGNQVRFTQLDHMRMRAFGDRYLEREHGLERQLDDQMERYARQHGVNILFEAERTEFEHFLFADPDRKLRESERDVREWYKIDEDWKKLLADSFKPEPGHYLGKSDYHEVGRISDLTALHANQAQQNLWRGVLENVPDMKDVAEEKLSRLQEDRKTLIEDIQSRTPAGDPWAVIDKAAEQMEREARALLRLLQSEQGDWNRSDIDLDKVPDEDKIKIGNGEIYTKYDSKQDLLDLDEKLNANPMLRIPLEEYKRLWSWIGNKEVAGDDYYGRPPLKERELESEPDTKQEPQGPGSLDDVAFDAKSQEDLLNKFANAANAEARSADVKEMQEVFAEAKVSAERRPVSRRESDAFDDTLLAAEDRDFLDYIDATHIGQEDTTAGSRSGDREQDEEGRKHDRDADLGA